MGLDYKSPSAWLDMEIVGMWNQQDFAWKDGIDTKISSLALAHRGYKTIMSVGMEHKNLLQVYMWVLLMSINQ